MSGLMPIVARVASAGVVKKIATRIVAGITGAGAKSVTPVYRNSGSVKVVPSKGMKAYTGDTDELTMVARPKASAPIRAKSSDAIRVNSNPMRGK